MNDPFDAEKWKYHNLERLEDSLQCLYDTVISEEGNAELRGMAITAIDRIIINMRGASAVEKIESIPFSARLRVSEDASLRKLSDDMGKHFGSEE